MANTWIAAYERDGERLAAFRTSDFDPVALYEAYGNVGIYDLTNEMSYVGTVWKFRDIHTGKSFIAMRAE